ncbi:heavy metal translocating P-type ATPase [Trueperella sp. LYQ143]|uniref:heavy metal translocating P-type ATPase n=1 Tax=unclassified Trueperella TaxID=2630174 RepID=UPI0039837B55
MLKSFISRYPLVVLVALTAVIGVLLSFGAPAATRPLVSIVAGGIALAQAKGMIDTLRDGNFGIDLLAVTAICSTLIVGEYWAALVVCLMLTGGEALEDYAESRAGAELTALLEGVPTTAYRREADAVIPIDIEDVRIGDRLVVRPHDTVPVDGILTSDLAILDESQLTGEALPVEHRAGDVILSGSLNGAESIDMTAQSTAADSQYQRIVMLVNEARESQAPFVRLADRVAVPFTIFALVLAGAAWALSGQAVRFAQVLVVATPCPLIIAAPVAFMAGMSRAARTGMIVKNAGTIEKIAAVHSIAFDKTGTLTAGAARIRQIRANGMDSTELLRYAASAEAYSSHPLAQTIVSAYCGERIEPENVQDIPGQGVCATVSGRAVRVGKYGFVVDGLTSEQAIRTVTSDDSGRSEIFVSIDGQLRGEIELVDPIRPETPATLDILRHMAGIEYTVMLTGDTRPAAQRVARNIGICEIHAELLPEDKVRTVQQTEPGRVMMVGDGVNDAPVLAVADVGVAMGARGSAAAVESADVVIMHDDLMRIPRLLLLGRQTMRIAWQAIGIGVSFSIILMCLGAVGVLPAFAGAWSQELVDLACILWALRASRSSRQEKELSTYSHELCA